MSQSLKVAILQNDHKSEGYWKDFREAFCSVISAAAPDSQINFFDPIELQVYPELSDNYDLIILSGGNAEHDGNVPWVLKMQAFIKTVAQNHPHQKLVGICWGHQAIHKSLGGTVGYRKEGAEVSCLHYITMIRNIIRLILLFLALRCKRSSSSLRKGGNSFTLQRLGEPWL